MVTLDFPTIVALFALLVAILTAIFTGLQTKKAGEAQSLNQQIARGQAVMHFTDRFFNLLAQGNPEDRIAIDSVFTYQFWSLQATEFYFFHHKLLPTFIYELWMIELVKLYRAAKDETIRNSHLDYLSIYSLNYPDMNSFFKELCEISKQPKDSNAINYDVSKYVVNWRPQQKRTLLN